MINSRLTLQSALLLAVLGVIHANVLLAADEPKPDAQPANAAAPQPPALRIRAEVQAVLGDFTAVDLHQKSILRPLKIVLLAGKKDHGPGEHDYPAWQNQWKALLAKLPAVTVETAFGWLSDQQWREANLVIAYYWNHEWSNERLKQLDEYFSRGGGLVHLHAASIHDHDGDVLAKRLGLAFEQPKMKWRHGPVELRIVAGSDEPITHRLPRTVSFHDEAYWLANGDASKVQVLATSDEDGLARPMLWTFEPGKDQGERGRVVCHVMGHYMWTFDDPLFRILVLRSAAWAAGEPTDRFLAAATEGVQWGDDKGPRVFLLDSRVLRVNKNHLHDGDKSLMEAIAQLERDAKRELNAGPFSVMNKDFTPPSGDQHDYMSQAPYFWKNPDTADGLPYVRRDGERNPEINKFRNHADMGRMMSAVDTLALAFYFTDDESYAAKAASLLRAWFLDPSTKMNPNLQFGQAIPGITNGRGIGLIETAGLAKLVDDIGVLQGSKSWTADDQRGIEAWFAQFLQWMLESRNGKEEAAAKNNHGTYYDVQTASFALFLGKDDLAKQILENVGRKRIAVQIEPDGRQPLELARTKAWGYSTSNLNGLMSLARLGEHVGVDLWNFETPDGRSIRKALDFLIPYYTSEEKWPFPQLGGWSPDGLNNALWYGADHFPAGTYRTIVMKVAGRASIGRNLLLRGQSPQRQ